MIIPKYRRPIEYINHKPYVLFGIIPINRVKNATLIKEWLGCDTAFKVHLPVRKHFSSISITMIISIIMNRPSFHRCKSDGRPISGPLFGRKLAFGVFEV